MVCVNESNVQRAAGIVREHLQTEQFACLIEVLIFIKLFEVKEDGTSSWSHALFEADLGKEQWTLSRFLVTIAA